MKQGGVIAYPTEYCFGLGCDPQNEAATRRILKIKRRRVDQGLILIAATREQIEVYANLPGSPMRDKILASWPGPVTWLLARVGNAPCWITGKHQTIAMRMTDHPIAGELCRQFGGALVSTSANRSGEAELTSAAAVTQSMQTEVDFIVDAAVGDAIAPSRICDGTTGELFR